MAPSATRAGQPQDGIAAERDDGEPDAGVVGHPGEDRHGEQGAHVPPGQRSQQDHDGRFRHVAHGDRGLAVEGPERLVEQEADQGQVEFPDPGGRQQGQGGHGVGAQAAQTGGEVLERHGIVGWIGRIGGGGRLGDRSGRRRRAIEPTLAAPSPRSEPSPRIGWAAPTARRCG